jgi:peroxiredoxin
MQIEHQLKIKKNMKLQFTILFILFGYSLFAQENEIQKPSYVIVANDEIITEEKLGELMQENYVKSMNKGVSQETRDELAEKFGDKIGEKEFVIIVELYTEENRPTPDVSIVANDSQETIDGLRLHTGDDAKNFTVEMIDGQNITLSDLKGKVVLLNFWATWCGPCLMELYEMPDKIIEPFKNSDFIFLPISRGESEEKVRNKMLQLNEKGISFNVGIDPEEKIWNEYATQSIPKNFLIDKKGVIRYISTGNSEGSVENLAEEIKILLGE